MRKRKWGLLMMATCVWLMGCAGPGVMGKGADLQIGQRESDLIVQKGQPQEVLPDPQGGKVYVYTRYRMDQVAIMGGGVWGKPEQAYYWLDSQGVITKVSYYPYGKRKFIFPTEKEPAAETRVASLPPGERASPPLPPAAARVTPAPQKEVVPAPSPPQKLAKSPEPAKVSAPAGDMEAAIRLELNMTKEEVRRLLGLPDRTEGFRAGGKSVIVWFYIVRDKQGRQVITPLVFEDGRLGGWGESFYNRFHKGASGPKP